MKKFLIKNWFVIIIIVLAIFKQLTVLGIKEWYNANQVCDDELMVNYANNLKNGDYLGEYNWITLVKGIGFSLFLAFLRLINVSYPMTFTFLNTISIVYFIYAIKYVLKNKISLLILYIFMLFNPLLYDYSTIAKLYNTGIQTFQINFIIAGYFILLTRRDMSKKFLLLHSIIVTFFTTWFYINRTDSIYILPFVIVASLIIIFKYCQKEKWRGEIVGIFVVVLPIISIITAKNIIINLNYKYYGVKIYNEYTDSNSYFNKVLKQLNSIKNKEDVKYCTNTKEKMERIFECSPTLQEIEEKYFNLTERWSIFDRNPFDLEVEDGWFYWVLKGAYNEVKEPKNAEEANNFWKKVYDEINIAIEKGKFEMQFSFPIMVSPWRSGYGIELLKSSFDILGFSAKLSDINVSYDTTLVQETFMKYVYIIYKFIVPVLFIVSILLYAWTLVRFLKNKKDENVFNAWLIITAIVLNIVLVIIGSAYTHITSFSMKMVPYLTIVYNLMIPFIFINLLYFIENFDFNIIRNWRKNEISRKVE